MLNTNVINNKIKHFMLMTIDYIILTYFLNKQNVFKVKI